MKKAFLASAVILGILNFGCVAKAEVLPIVHINDENHQTLRNENKPVELFDENLKKLIDDMRDTMDDEEGGCGLAAPQIGVNTRIFVAQLSNGFQEFINPQITEISEEKTVGMEGCLSIPNTFGMVERPAYTKIQAYNKNGEEFVLELENFDARVVNHEFDHLNKILFTDIAKDTINTTGLSMEEIRNKVWELLKKYTYNN